MNRLQFVLVPLLVAVGLLAYAAFQDALTVEQIVAVGVFLVIAVPVGILGYRLSQRERER
jgi:predicted Na+-dependent transporter